LPHVVGGWRASQSSAIILYKIRGAAVLLPSQKWNCWAGKQSVAPEFE
jgi:hypothetical protein